MSEGYRTGYKRPPREHRFKTGQSGNPSGRPKGARSLADEVRAALRKRITVTENGRKRQISVIEAALQRLVQQAIGESDLRAIRDVLTLADTYGAEAGRAVLPGEDEALLAAALRRLGEQGGEGGA